MGCVGAVALAAAVAVVAVRGPTLGPQLACADVASSVGLTFTGDYGPVFPVSTPWAT